MKRPSKTPPKAKAGIAVVVDGNTEVWYLNMLKRNERQIRIAIKPEIPSKKSITEQYEYVCDLAEKEFSRVFWIVDLDTIIKETREAPKGETPAMETFKTYRQHLLDKYENVKVVVNNPCLEFWFILHFEKTGKLFDNCSKAEKHLKTYLKDYQKKRSISPDKMTTST